MLSGSALTEELLALLRKHLAQEQVRVAELQSLSADMTAHSAPARCQTTQQLSGEGAPATWCMHSLHVLAALESRCRVMTCLPWERTQTRVLRQACRRAGVPTLACEGAEGDAAVPDAQQRKSPGAGC